MKFPRIELDYIAERPRPLWLGLLLLALGLGAGADFALQYSAIQREKSQLEAVHGLVTSERPAPKALPPERLAEQAKAAEATVRQLTLPWATLISTLENAATKDVAVLQVQPEAQQQLMRITAEARNHNAMLDYVRKLVASGTLTNVHWINHQIQAEDPQRPLQFSLQATFRLVK